MRSVSWKRRTWNWTTWMIFTPLTLTKCPLIRFWSTLHQALSDYLCCLWWCYLSSNLVLCWKGVNSRSIEPNKWTSLMMNQFLRWNLSMRTSGALLSISYPKRIRHLTISKKKTSALWSILRDPKKKSFSWLMITVWMKAVKCWISGLLKTTARLICRWDLAIYNTVTS